MSKKYIISFYSRFVAETFENPITDAMDIVETAKIEDAQVFPTLDEVKTAYISLAKNPKFYNAAGQPVLTIATAPARAF